MANRDRWSLCRPEIISGRKLWVARRNSGLPEVWVHETPYKKHFAYLTGRALTEGATQQDDDDYLAHLLAEDIAELAPMSSKLEKMWDAERGPK